MKKYSLFQFGKLKLVAILCLFLAIASQAATTFDTAALSPLTSAVNGMAAWISGNLVGCMVGLIIAVAILALVKFGGKKAKP